MTEGRLDLSSSNRRVSGRLKEIGCELSGTFFFIHILIKVSFSVSPVVQESWAISNRFRW